MKVSFMTKLAAIILVCIMAVSLTACGGISQAEYDRLLQELATLQSELDSLRESGSGNASAPPASPSAGGSGNPENEGAAANSWNPPPDYDENPVTDFEYRGIVGGAEITAYVGTSAKVRIPGLVEGLTVLSIGASAFAGKGLSEVYIPNSVTSIGHSAFSGNVDLTAITIPVGVTSVEHSTFSGNSALATVNIPDSVTSIGHSAFSGNSSLTTITIPDGVTKLVHSTFSGCVSLPEGVQKRISKLIYGYDSIEFGGYSWLVLEESGSRVLLLSLEVIDKRAFHSPWEAVTWESSAMRRYLNGEFYNSFSPADQNRIIRTDLINNDNQEFETAGGNNTSDSIFLLSIDEALTYFADPSSGVALDAGGEASWWWLRSPGFFAYYAAFVYDVGSIFAYGAFIDNATGGVRPALWLDL